MTKSTKKENPKVSQVVSISNGASADKRTLHTLKSRTKELICS